jgi:glyoxylase-like metal-dependent hydrolase (beta-lactamase superfamily II)
MTQGLQAAIVPVTEFQQNCALLWDAESKRGAVIDPGGDVPKILEAIQRFGVTVEHILLTHGHLDHAGGAAELAAALKVKVEGPDRRDEFLLEGIPDQAARFGLQGLSSVTPDRWLAEGDTVQIAGRDFSVLHCPGHTPGHVVFVRPEDSVAILGDVLFRGSVGRTDFPYGDHAALISSITEKLLPLGDDIAFLCGHGPGSTLGTERRQNPFLRG